MGAITVLCVIIIAHFSFPYTDVSSVQMCAFSLQAKQSHISGNATILVKLMITLSWRMWVVCHECKQGKMALKMVEVCIAVVQQVNLLLLLFHSWMLRHWSSMLDIEIGSQWLRMIIIGSLNNYSGVSYMTSVGLQNID